MAKTQRAPETWQQRWLRRALLAGSLGAGLVLGGGIAYAYWNTLATATLPPLQTGTFDLTVNGQFLGPEGGTIPWNAFDGIVANGNQGLYPTESWAEQISFTVANNSQGDNALMQVTIAGVASNVSGFGNSGEYLTVTAYQGNSTLTATNSGAIPHRSGSCTGTVVATSTIGALTTPVTYLAPVLAPGVSQTVNLCFVVRVADAMPNPNPPAEPAGGNAQNSITNQWTQTNNPGGVANFAVNITAKQVRP